MSGDSKAGMGANVGVKKMNEDGEVEQKEGPLYDGHSRRAWVLFFSMLVLDGFGLWKVLELLAIV